MGFFTAFSFIKNLGIFKYIDIKIIIGIILIAIIIYGNIKINYLEKDVDILKSKITAISQDRDNCKKINESNKYIIEKTINDSNKMKENYNNMIASRDKIIIKLRRDFKLVQKKISQKPTKTIIVKKCKINLIEGEKIKDEEFKDLYNSISNIGN